MKEHERQFFRLLKDLEMLEIPAPNSLYNKVDKVADFAPTRTRHSLVFGQGYTIVGLNCDILLEKDAGLFHPFTIQVSFDQAYRIPWSGTTCNTTPSWAVLWGNWWVITGHLAPKNAWRLEEFYHHGYLNILPAMEAIPVSTKVLERILAGIDRRQKLQFITPPQCDQYLPTASLEGGLPRRAGSNGCFGASHWGRPLSDQSRLRGGQTNTTVSIYLWAYGFCYREKGLISLISLEATYGPLF